MLPPLPPSRDYPAEASRSRDPIRENWYVIGRWDNELFEKRPLRDTPPFYPVQDLRVAAGMGAFHAVAAAEGGAAGGVAAARRRHQRQAMGRRDRPGALGEAGCRLRRSAPAVGLSRSAERLSGVFWLLGAARGGEQRGRCRQAGLGECDAFHIGRGRAKGTERVVGIIEGQRRCRSAVPCFTPGLSLGAVGRRALGWQRSARAGNWAGQEREAQWVSGGARLARQTGFPGGTRGGRERAPASDSNPFGDESKPEAVAKTVAGPAADVAEEQKDLGYRLFRFFDFTVEPGKRYIYRVKLAVANPNYLLKPTVLKKAELAQKKCLMTDWSEPSPIISMPRDTQVLVNAVKPAPRANTEPTFQVTVVKWLIRSGVKVSYDSPVMRGQLANFGDIQKREAGGPVNFFSDTTVVDLRGGEHLGKKGSAATSPGEILLVDADGSLSVRNEVDDSAACRQLTEAPAPEAAPRQPQVMPKAGAAPAPAGRGFGALVTPPTTPRKPRR